MPSADRPLIVFGNDGGLLDRTQPRLASRAARGARRAASARSVRAGAIGPPCRRFGYSSAGQLVPFAVPRNRVIPRVRDSSESTTRAENTSTPACGQRTGGNRSYEGCGPCVASVGGGCPGTVARSCRVVLREPVLGNANGVSSR